MDLWADGRPALRGAVPLAVATRWRAPARSTRPTTTSSTPATSARRGARCASRARYPWHVGHGAAFGEKSGWERVNWYEANARRRRRVAAPARLGRASNWSPAIEAEHRATRERAGLFDESSFAKLEVAGPGAAAFLESLCDNRVARDVGRITYTQMLNARGGIECDFTVTRLEEELFPIVTGTAFGTHDLSWLRRHAPRGRLRARGRRHGARGPASRCGGRAARDILAPLTPDLARLPAT